MFLYWEKSIATARLIRKPNEKRISYLFSVSNRNATDMSRSKDHIILDSVVDRLGLDLTS